MEKARPAQGGLPWLHQVQRNNVRIVKDKIADYREKLPVVYDGVGQDTFDVSLDCLRPRGLMVSFGNASGAPEPLDLQILANKGSLYITRPTMVTYTATTEELQQSSRDVFSRVLDGDLRIEINQRYSLAEVQQAHRDLESRATTGSTVILP